MPGANTITALTGVVGSVVTRTDDEMSIRDLLLADHTKADTLFAEILGSNDPEKKSKSILATLQRHIKFMVQPRNKSISGSSDITNTHRNIRPD